MKTKRHIVVVLMVLMLLVLMPGISIQAKSKCNHKNITWVTKTKATCTNRGLKYKKCKSCGKKWTDVIRRTPALGNVGERCSIKKHRNVNAVEKEKFLITINNEDMR